jgi:stage III sporulation protein AA
MLNKVLPQSINFIVENCLDYKKLYEIRLRADMPIMINYASEFVYLSDKGVSAQCREPIVADRRMIENVVLKAGEYSLYAYNDRLKNGFITMQGGIRIGVSGDIVTENGCVKTIKNFSSLNIRIPHEINAKNAVLEKILRPIFSTLIISPPGCGKTTLLREVARALSNQKKILSTLIIDERSEIAAVHNCVPQLNVGSFTDVLNNADKAFGFSAAIRVMRPDVIITDELGGASDIAAVAAAINSGASVFASIHARNADGLKNNDGLKSILDARLFKRFVILSDRLGAGTVESVLDESLTEV